MWDVALVAVALGLSNFAASIGIGLSGVNGGLRIRIALIFGFFEAAMPLVGLLIGHRVASSVGSAAPFLGGGLLIATGIISVIQARRRLPSGAAKSFQPGRLVVTGAALGIDNLVIGFALGAYKVPVLLAAAVFAAVSVAMSLVGLEIGSRLGASVERWSSEIGGLVLILVGIAIAAGVF
jgi:putative Mn2+ efflux pump MntP